MTRDNKLTIAAYAAVCAVMLVWLLVLRGGMQDAARQRTVCLAYQVGRDRDFYERQIAACTARITSGREGADRLAREYENRSLAHLLAHEFGQGVQDMDEVVKREPANATALYNRAGALLQLGEPQKALVDLNRAIQLKADYAKALGMRASLQLMQRKPDLAIADLDKMLRLEPKNANARRLLGGAYAQKKQFEMALTQFRQAIQLAPKDTRGYVDAAGSLLQLGRNDEAIAMMDRAVAVSPSDESYAERAQFQFDIGHYEAAVADMDRALQKRDEPVYRNNRCWFRATWGQQLNEALEDCDRAVAAEPQAAGFLDSRGFVQFRLGNFQAAKTDYDEALRLAPNMAGSRYMRGLARLRSGDEGGQSDIGAARAASPDALKFYDRLGLRP